MVDLFLDLEALVLLPSGAGSETGLVSILLDAVQVIDVASFRNVVVCGSSVPESIGKRNDWIPLRVPRIELRVWERTMLREGRILMKFGDYGIAYAFEDDPDSPVRPPSRIRLFAERDHVMNRAPRGEYRKLCSAVITSSEFARLPPAWGAASLLACGRGSGGEGNPTDWVARDTNIHLEATPRLLHSFIKEQGRIGEIAFREPETFAWRQSELAIPSRE